MDRSWHFGCSTAKMLRRPQSSTLDQKAIIASFCHAISGSFSVCLQWDMTSWGSMICPCRQKNPSRRPGFVNWLRRSSNTGPQKREQASWPTLEHNCRLWKSVSKGVAGEAVRRH